MNPSGVVLHKLKRLFGEEAALEIYSSTLEKLNLSNLQNPNDELRFGGELVGRGGLLSVVGRSITTHAFLKGAKKPRDWVAG